MSDIGWGIIGVPNGFQHISQGITANTANTAISAVDNRLCIEDYEKEPLYAVIYDTTIVGATNTRQLMTYFVQYNFAKEAEKKRLGSFYGSYIAIPGRLPSDIKCCEKIVKVLQELSFYNQEIFMEGNKFNKEYSNDYELPPELEKIIKDIIENTAESESSPKKIDSKRSIIVYGDSPSEVFLNSVELYDTYSIIYISNSKEYCEYIEQNKNIICKKTVDLIKESSDIVDARYRELERQEKEKQEKIERERNEKNRKLREEEEKDRATEEEIKKTFRNMEEIFFYACTKNAGLDDLIKDYNSEDSNALEELKIVSESLREFADISSNISKVLESRKLNLDKEIVKLEGNVYQVHEEITSAVNAIENQNNRNNTIGRNSGTINDNSRSKRDSITSQASRGYINNDGRDPYRHVNNNSLFKNKIFWIIAGIVLLITLGFTMYYFFDKNTDFFKSKSEVLSSKSTAKIEEDNNLNQNLENTNTNTNTENESDVLYEPVDIEPNNENNNLTIDSSSRCDYTDSLFQSYTLTRTDIMEDDRLRFDSEIISKIMEGILRKESASNLSNINKDEFKRMLMSCNDKLNYKKYDSNNLGSDKLLTVMEGSEIKYSKNGYSK